MYGNDKVLSYGIYMDSCFKRAFSPTHENELLSGDIIHIVIGLGTYCYIFVQEL